jgi:Mn-dependent DtxR family transcriptional regulator
LAEGNIAKTALQLERDGETTIKEGRITLTEKGIAYAMKLMDDTQSD